MCSLQISVLFVLMRVEISLFSSGILGFCGVFLPVKSRCATLLEMGCSKSLCVLSRCVLISMALSSILFEMSFFKLCISFLRSPIVALGDAVLQEEQVELS